jgi:2-oxoglutarate ferredoxin oxidoreductase subunit gamma
VPANDIAEELGNVRMANVVLLGAYFAATGTMPLEAVEAALDLHLGQRQRKYLSANKQALRRGAESVAEMAAA